MGPRIILRVVLTFVLELQAFFFLHGMVLATSGAPATNAALKKLTLLFEWLECEPTASAMRCTGARAGCAGGAVPYEVILLSHFCCVVVELAVGGGVRIIGVASRVHTFVCSVSPLSEVCDFHQRCRACTFCFRASPEGRCL